MSDGDDSNSRLNRAAALYYLAMNSLVRGDQNSARRYLADAVDALNEHDEYSANTFYTEYVAARTELAGL